MVGPYQAELYFGGVNLIDTASSTESHALGNAAVPQHTAQLLGLAARAPHHKSALPLSKQAGQQMPATSFYETQTSPASVTKTVTSRLSPASLRKPLSVMCNLLLEKHPVKPQLLRLRLLLHMPPQELCCILPRNRAISKILGRR